MEHHGSESYFVIGEGLLGESVGGRERTVADAATPPPPPFRFSRMGPNGINHQLAEGNRKKIAAAMTSGGGGSSQIPAGFTYLGQFVDHDLTFDKTTVMLGEHVSPAQLLQARSPSLDLDSLYGAGPTDPESAKFYEADGIHLKMGKTAAFEGLPAKDGFDLPRGAGNTNAKKRKAIIPDPRNDENLAVAQTHLAFIRFHNRVVDTLPSSVPPSAAVRDRPRARHQALPVGTAHRLPPAHLPTGHREQRLHERPEGVRGRRDADRRSHDADRVLGRGVPPRPLDDPAGLQLEPDLRRRLRQPRPAVRVLRSQR